MREPVINIYCDFHWQDGQQRVPATKTFAVGVIEGETRPPIKRLEACEPCAKVVTDLMVVLGGAVGLTVAPRPPELVYHRSPSQAAVDCPVIDCGVTLSGRNSLYGHIYSQHRMVPKPAAPSVCPECGYQNKASVVGQHRVTNHDYDQIAEALVGVKGVRRH